MNLFHINTSAWIEEDFMISTSLTEQQVSDIILKMVNEERESDDVEHRNEDYVNALNEAYPESTNFLNITRLVF